MALEQTSFDHSFSITSTRAFSPIGIRWQRISITLLIVSFLQCFASIYIWLYISHRIFFALFIGYAIIALLFMLWRVKHGHVWFALGGLIYCVWLSVLLWEAIIDKRWVQMCVDFTIATFEFLIFCLALSRYHELGGFTRCCGVPNRNWRGRMLVGDESVIRIDLRDEDYFNGSGTLMSVHSEDSVGEAERFVSSPSNSSIDESYRQQLIAYSERDLSSASPSFNSTHPSLQTSTSYIPPPLPHTSFTRPHSISVAISNPYAHHQQHHLALPNHHNTQQQSPHSPISQVSSVSSSYQQRIGIGSIVSPKP